MKNGNQKNRMLRGISTLLLIGSLCVFATSCGDDDRSDSNEDATSVSQSESTVLGTDANGGDYKDGDELPIIWK